MHVPYFTVRPVVGHRNDMPHTRDEHLELVFVGAAQWPFVGQLATADKSPSWRLWFEFGPFTLAAKPTAAGYRAADELADARSFARMRQQIEAGALAELERLFPASVALHR